MDLSKIFIKDACPTKVGGQAVLEGVMMKGDERTSVCVRLPNGDLYIKTEKNKNRNHSIFLFNMVWNRTLYHRNI